MRRLYAERRALLLETLHRLGAISAVPAALAVMVPLPPGYDDEALCGLAKAHDLHPAPLSPWFTAASKRPAGLLMGCANVSEQKVEQHCKRLLSLVDAPLPSAGQNLLIG